MNQDLAPGKPTDCAMARMIRAWIRFHKEPNPDPPCFEDWYISTVPAFLRPQAE